MSSISSSKPKEEPRNIIYDLSHIKIPKKKNNTKYNRTCQMHKSDIFLTRKKNNLLFNLCSLSEIQNDFENLKAKSLIQSGTEEIINILEGSSTRASMEEFEDDFFKEEEIERAKNPFYKNFEE